MQDLVLSQLVLWESKWLAQSLGPESGSSAREEWWRAQAVGKAGGGSELTTTPELLHNRGADQQGEKIADSMEEKNIYKLLEQQRVNIQTIAGAQKHNKMPRQANPLAQWLKLPLAMPPRQAECPSQSMLLLPPSSPLTCLGRCWRIAQDWCCRPHGRPKPLWFWALAWSSPGCCDHVESE